MLRQLKLFSVMRRTLHGGGVAVASCYNHRPLSSSSSSSTSSNQSIDTKKDNEGVQSTKNYNANSPTITSAISKPTNTNDAASP